MAPHSPGAHPQPDPGGAPELPDDPADTLTLATAFQQCQRCLGAYLRAAETWHPVACPDCGHEWVCRRPRRDAPVDVPGDLEALARWLPAIVGRAWAPGDGGTSARHGERSDHVDAHHRDRRAGLRTALGALATLDALERAGDHRLVRVLWFAYVLVGPELAKTHKGGREDLVAGQFGSRDQLAFWKSHKSRSVRATQIETYGRNLLAGARAAYEAVARGRRVAPPPAPDGDVTQELSRLLERTLARVASGAPEVANDSR
jgi:predicted RNA-binding Zn-ribbon protein involved in translation (DUF1610 family)